MGDNAIIISTCILTGIVFRLSSQTRRQPRWRWMEKVIANCACWPFIQFATYKTTMVCFAYHGECKLSGDTWASTWREREQKKRDKILPQDVKKKRKRKSKRPIFTVLKGARLYKTRASMWARLKVTHRELWFTATKWWYSAKWYDHTHSWITALTVWY